MERIRGTGSKYPNKRDKFDEMHKINFYKICEEICTPTQQTKALRSNRSAGIFSVPRLKNHVGCDILNLEI